MENIDTNITNKLFDVARILEKTSDIFFAQLGVTFTGYETLKHINAGTNTTTALAITMNGILSNITHKTKVLEEAGLIERSFNKNDKRIWHFAITKKGTIILKLIESTYEKATRQLYSEFANSQKQQILNFLNKIESHLKHVLGEHKAELNKFAKNFNE